VNGIEDEGARAPGAGPGEETGAGPEAKPTEIVEPTDETTPHGAPAGQPVMGETPPEPALPPTPEEVADLRKRAAERDEYLDLLKRARADFANYQKRVAEDRKRWGAAAQRDLLARLMGAADHCRLSAEKSKGDDSAESLRDCIGLIWAELEKFLDSSGVKFVPTRGQRFDPHRHEAVSMQEREDLPDATIIDEIRPGYEFGGQVIRPSQVVVSKRPKPPEPPSVDSSENDDAAPETPPGAGSADGQEEERG
jgi:molecular chaperone GrpE